MDEDFLDVTENSKKVWLIFILIVIILGLVGYFFIFKKYTFGVKTVKVELGSAISTNVEDYLTRKITNPQDYKLDLKNANANEVGTYNYTITYNKVTKTGKITVEDTTPPEFEPGEMTIEEGTEEYYLGNLLTSCEDISMPCLVTLKDEKDENKFNTIGKYDIEIYVSDLYGNKKSTKATLNVVEKGTYVDPKSSDLEVASNSKEDPNFKGTVFQMLEKGYQQDTDEASDSLNEVSSVDFEAYVKTNFPGYNLVSTDIIELYNKSTYVIGYSIEIKISNGTETKTVYAEKSKVPATTITDSDNDTNKDTN